MRTLGNILWHFPFFGFVTALLAFLVGTLLTLLVIPAPIGLGLIQLSKFTRYFHKQIKIRCAVSEFQGRDITFDNANASASCCWDNPATSR